MYISIKRFLCHRCNAPVFTHEDIDSEGNIVISSRCWNGHIRDMYIKGIEKLEMDKAIDRIGDKDELIAYIGLYDTALKKV